MFPPLTGMFLPVTGWPSHLRGGSPCVRGCHGFTARRCSWGCRPLMAWARRSPFITKMAVRTMPFDVVHYIDPVVFDWVLSKVGGKAGRKARFIADPVEPLSLPTRSKARAMLRLPEHKKLIMSIGLQDHRKGADYLIRACARWQPAEPASIVLAGMLSAQIRQLVTNEYRHLVDDGRLIVLDQYLSKEDFYACFAAGDLIATPYRPQPHPSHIVLHAATAGKMVLAANSGWSAYMVPKFSLGRLCDPQDPELLAETFDPALHEAEAYKLSAAAKRLVEFHRSENFVLQWRQELSRIMGKPEDALPRDWNWVLNGEDEKFLSRQERSSVSRWRMSGHVCAGPSDCTSKPARAFQRSQPPNSSNDLGHLE